MTRIFSEGFEMKDTVNVVYTFLGSIDTSQKRSGAASYKMVKGVDYVYNVSDLSEAYIRFGLRWGDESGTPWDFYLYWRHGTTVLGSVYISFDTNGFLQVKTGSTTQDTGSISINKDTWYSIEVHIKIDDATGAIETKVDGLDDATFSGDTKPGADAHFDNLRFFSQSGGAGDALTVWLDDMGINDTAGGVDDSWLGDGRIIVIKPNGDTATLDLTPSAAVAHYTLVDDIPADGDSTYVEGSVDDEEDMYDLAACGLGDVIITRIWTEARSKDTGATGKSVALITLASGGAEVSGGDLALTGTYTVKVKGAEQLVNPVDSAAWEVADIDALQAGLRTRP